MEHDKLERVIRGWEAMAPAFGCSDLPARMDPIARCELYTGLAFERLQRKESDLNRLFELSMQNWHQTLYLMILRTVGDLQNREAFMELGQRVTLQALLRERHSLVGIEALLFGGAGLLDGCRDDSYIRLLKEEFEHLRHKYRIEPLDPSRWRISRLRPANHPRLRLAQIAALVMQPDFTVEKILECRTAADVEKIFGVEAQQYWSSYYNPSTAIGHTTKRLGAEKAQSIGINLVAVLQYFYGHRMGREELTRRAIELWEALPAEQNRYTRLWERITPINAFESQALLQLAREYCEKTRCRECPLAKRRLYELRRAESGQ
ncbi:MAG: DUF2851 family protein [Rikenellaceae bacterium]|nr:DUF2851 family protein [Rikenellaceae bacterium]